MFSFRGPLEAVIVMFSRQLTVSPQAVLSQIYKLQEENLSLKLQISQYTQLEEDNKRLQEALGFENDKKIELIGSEIIAFSPSDWRRQVMLNAGSTKGVSEGAFVVDQKGNLVGKIMEVKKNLSVLLLVSDPDFNLPVIVGAKGVGMLKGDFSGAKILYIDSEDEIASGDIILASLPGYGTTLKIGSVKKIQKNNNDLFWEVDASLFMKTVYFKRIFIVK
ncbi:MAG: rod shape-determining protein MreC [Candidatus Omnitrophica bacterium]|nr:rod shape-determining protein MreC [Candidatus Omnitrophota bacterium]